MYRALLALMAAGCGRVGFDAGADAPLGARIDLDFTQGDSASIVVSRGTAASYVNASGLIQSAPPDTPRFDHEPQTLASLGLRIEPAGNNLLWHSEALEVSTPWFSNGAMVVSPDVITALDGTPSADELVDQDTVGQARRANGQMHPSDLLPYTCSAFVRAGTVTIMELGCEILLGTLQVQQSMRIDLATGSILTPPPIDDGHGIAAYGNGWWRIWLTVLNNGTGNVEGLLSLLNDRMNPAIQGSYFAWGAQYEQAPTPTSYQPTAAGIGPRAADRVELVSSSVTPAARSLRVRARVHAATTPVTPIACMQLDEGDQLCIVRDNATARVRVELRGGSPAMLDAGSWPLGSARTIDVAWSAVELRVSDDTSATVYSTPASVPAFTRVLLGSDGTTVLDGHLEQVALQ